MKEPPLLKGRIRRVEPPLHAEAKELDSGDEYLWRATRVDLETMSLVVVECAHPNVGYYEEMCLFISTMHYPDWECVPLSEFWPQWKDVKKFVRSFPAFKELFKHRDWKGEILGKIFLESPSPKT
ncbi:MAG: hypothetical protein QXL58_04540 [Candidatus Hadarchaeales archaeon]